MLKVAVDCAIMVSDCCRMVPYGWRIWVGIGAGLVLQCTRLLYDWCIKVAINYTVLMKDVFFFNMCQFV